VATTLSAFSLLLSKGAAVIEEAPQGELLSNGVAEGLADGAAPLSGEVILSVHPGEELVDEGRKHGL
jgi:hypothetical protein